MLKNLCLCFFVNSVFLLSGRWFWVTVERS